MKDRPSSKQSHTPGLGADMEVGRGEHRRGWGGGSSPRSMKHVLTITATSWSDPPAFLSATQRPQWTCAMRNDIGRGSVYEGTLALPLLLISSPSKSIYLGRWKQTG